MTSQPKKIEVADLTQIDKLELQNILLKRDLYNLQISQLDDQKQNILKQLLAVNESFKSWRGKYAPRLDQQTGLKFEEVDIDAETGKVTPNNISKMTIPEIKKAE